MTKIKLNVKTGAFNNTIKRKHNAAYTFCVFLKR